MWILHVKCVTNSLNAFEAKKRKERKMILDRENKREKR